MSMARQGQGVSGCSPIADVYEVIDELIAEPLLWEGLPVSVRRKRS